VSGSHLPLGKTLERLDALIAESGRDRDEVLNIAELRDSTRLPEEQVSSLLNGETLPDETVRERLTSRINALVDAHVAETGQRIVDVRADIAATVGVSAEWVRRWLAGTAVPNIEDMMGLRKHFKVEEGFFTAPASDLLARELEPILLELEGPVDPMTQLVKELGLTGVSPRAKTMSPREKTILAKMIRSLLEEEE